MIDFQSIGIVGYGEVSLDELDIYYLEKYWLNLESLVSYWAGLLDQAFIVNRDGPEIRCQSNMEYRPGGVLFTEQEFLDFKRLSIDLGAKSFAVIEYIGQSEWVDFSSRSFFRFAYPLDVSWSEMTSSCPIADDVFMRPIRAFFVISDNGRIGKYVDSDAFHPYELFFFSNS